MNSVGLSAGPMLVRVAWHDEIADASGVGALARRSARRVVRSSTLRSSTLRSSSSAAAASERQPIEKVRYVRAARSARCKKVAKKLQFQAPRQEACRPPGFATASASPPPRPRPLPCALHTSTRVQSTLDTHAQCVRASPAMYMLSRDNTRSRQKAWLLPCSSHWPLADRRPARRWHIWLAHALQARSPCPLRAIPMHRRHAVHAIHLHRCMLPPYGRDT